MSSRLVGSARFAKSFSAQYTGTFTSPFSPGRCFHKSIKKTSVAFAAGHFDSAFLKDFSTGELFLFMVIGMATLNKPILNICIKAFPYVPLPIIKALVYKIYCGGETIEDVKQTGQRLATRGINNMMISLTIEACEGNDNIDPQFIVDETKRSVSEILVPHTVSIIENSGKDINSIPAGYVALKPTGFTKNAAAVLRNHDSPENKAAFEEIVAGASAVCKTIYEANQKLAQKYPARTAPFVVGVIDAEKYDLQPGVYELQRRLYQLYNKLDAPVSVVGTLQMYLSGSSDLLAEEEKLARENKYRLGLKLVRGAYIHSEQQRASVIHKTKEDTDINYNRGISYCIESILGSQGNSSTVGHLVVASHNADSLKLATEKTYRGENSFQNTNKANICLGQLLGMADSITHDLIKTHKVDNVIKYVAWGPPLETREYLLRRLEENGDAVKNDTGLPLIKAAARAIFQRASA
ncbi:FAD-linked oxidoreductase [Metschnikowia bicuspidata var. bicuspidata NRRL YB-4993]|uniref:Proline dehydrogenase n=1 Tax=Metschnikowia bicuspidata var. bicuspidata NRRL YB-4993 TaxID=869754 RepID=A0A1A0H8G4_9ASCO|nr:FAD-linked oxidoreductase [Metschnikowia bicuspidata var. bicuspidata NRRL YB-4993]OBA20280.1 FAD-linked oxidoreductase [Metschnikowia bicuspidata var. bicuspidata NRRL YB-4993]